MSGAGRAESIELSDEEREIAALLANCESREPIAQAALLLQRAAFMAYDRNVVVDLIGEEFNDLLSDLSLSDRAAIGGPILGDRDAAMLGARWLLHVGQYSFEDACRDTGIPHLRAPKRKDGTPHFAADDHALAKQSGNVSLRQHIAFYCLKRALRWSGEDFSSPRLHLRIPGKEVSEREAFVAQHLTQAIYARLARLETDEPFRAEREIAWAGLGLVPRESGSTNASDDRNKNRRNLQSAWIQHREQLASRLDRSPRYYPEHLPPTVLASLLSLVRDFGDAAEPGVRYCVLPLTDIPALLLGQRAAILGDPGAGKSTFLRAHAVTTLRGGSARAVAFVRLADYVAVAKERRPADIEAMTRIMARCGLRQLQTKPAKRDVDTLSTALLEREDSLLLLDGVDEVLGVHDRRFVEDLLDELPALAASVVLTSRPSQFSPRPGWDRYVIDGSPDIFARLISLWYPERNLPRQIAEGAVEGSPRLQALAHQPFYAGLIAVIAGQLRHARVVDLSASAIVAAAATYILEREWRHPGEIGREPAEVLSILSACEDAAWTMAVADPSAPAPEAFRVSASYQELAAAGVDVERVAGSDLFTAEVREHGATAVGQHFYWVHRGFQDYFVGKRLAEQWRRGEDRWILEETIQLSSWTGSLGTMLEILPEHERSVVVRSWLSSDLAIGRLPRHVLENIASAMLQAPGYEDDVSASVVHALVQADLLMLAQQLRPNLLALQGVLTRIGLNIEERRFKPEQLLHLPDDVARRIAVTYRMCTDTPSEDLPLVVAERIEALLSRPTNDA